MSKYITEIANDIAKSCPDLVENGCGNDNCVACLAFKLTGLGYQKQEWISVDERLPEESDWYLANIITLFNLEFVSVAHYSKGYGWNNPDIITHWMPLPEAPKMKGGAE